jgi:hypothetical protein
VLFADGESDLREEAAVFDGGDAANELVASADFAEIAAAGGGFASVEGCGNEAVDFGFGDAVVAAGGLGGFEFAAVDPLLQRGVADAEDVGSFAWGKESLHGISVVSGPVQIISLFQYDFIQVCKTFLLNPEKHSFAIP